MAEKETNSVDQLKAHIAEQDARIQQLEEQIQKPTIEEAKVSVADMNQMYSNHLATIDTTLAIVSFFILVGGSVFGWLGFTTIRKMIENRLEGQITEITDRITKTAIEPLRAEYHAVLKEQLEQKETTKKNKEELSNRLEAEHHFSLAGRYYQDEKYKEAINSYSKVIELEPESSDAYVNRGVAYAKLEQRDMSMKDYNKAIELDPDDIDAYFNRAISYDFLGQADAAIKDYTKAIEIDSSYARAYVNRATVYSDLGQFDEAINDCNQAIKLNPSLSNSYYNKACAFSLMKKPITEVLELLEKAINLDGDSIKIAQSDDGFESIRENEQFRKLVGLD